MVVVLGSALRGHHLAGAGDLAADPADRGDQLGHGVLAGDRVIEDRGVQRPPRLAGQRTGRRDDTLTASKIRFGRSQAASRRRQ